MSSGIPVTDEIQGNLNIRDFSGKGDHGHLLVESDLTVLGTVIAGNVTAGNNSLTFGGTNWVLNANGLFFYTS